MECSEVIEGGDPEGPPAGCQMFCTPTAGRVGHTTESVDVPDGWSLTSELAQH